MAEGKKTGGRQKGTPNKLGGQAKENIVAVFNRLGGTQAMAEWASENQTQFYNIYAKLLPHEMTGVDGEPIKHSVEHSKRPKLTRDEWLRLNGLDK